MAKCCNKCGCVKPLQEFVKRADSKSGYGPCCKKCHANDVKERRARGTYTDEGAKQRSKDWYEKNRAHVIARADAWRKNNPERFAEISRARFHRRRARIAGNGGSFSPEQIKELHSKQRGKCAVCSSCLIEYQIDHIYPVATGGGSDIENIQLLCPPCNRAKAAKHPIDFMQERGMLL